MTVWCYLSQNSTEIKRAQSLDGNINISGMKLAKLFYKPVNSTKNTKPPTTHTYVSIFIQLMLYEKYPWTPCQEFMLLMFF